MSSTKLSAKFWQAFIVLIFCCLIAGPAVVFAQEESTGDEAVTTQDDTATDDGQGTDQGDESTAEDDAPAFSNPAQAQHAANLAEASAALAEAANVDEDPAVVDAQEAYDAAVNNPETTKEELEALAAALDEARENAMAENAGVTEDDIAAMRAEGMGWGEIAHELGVHPGTLGLGHTKRAMEQHGFAKGKGPKGGTDDELAEATARNLQSGWSKNHGVNTGNNDGSKGVGLGRAGKKSAKSSASGGNGNGGPGGGSKGNSKGGNSAGSNAGGNGKGGGKGGGKGK